MNDISVPAIGKPLDRVDGFAKVTGAAKYSAEWPVKGVAHGVLVRSSIARGKITALDAREASAVPGVLGVFSHLNPLPQPPPENSVFAEKEEERGSGSMSLRLLGTPEISYNGQYVALVVAETLEQAQEAAGLVRVGYDIPTPIEEARQPGRADRPPVALAKELEHAELPTKIRDDPPERQHGDAAAALAAAPAKLDRGYGTPWETHNPMEPHATLAQWDGDKLTVYDATQSAIGVRKMLSKAFALPYENVRVINKFIGGAFGSKGLAWPHVILTVSAAKAVGKPVKVALHRHDMFTNVGYRSPTLQRVQLGASADGYLASVVHTGFSQRAQHDEFVEPFTDPTANMYGTPTMQLSQKLSRLNVCRPTFMRAPGEVSGMFALECAMDELAYQLGIDPVELRLRNDTGISPLKQLPFSSRSFAECVKLAADKFGWSRRDPKPRSQRKGSLLIGYGMAGSLYPVNRSGAQARLVLRADGGVLAQSATQDLGTGTYTVMAQFLAELLAVPIENVRFDCGDAAFPEAPVAGGSQSAGSVGSALQAAVDAATEKLIQMSAADPASPLRGVAPSAVELKGGRLSLKGDPARGETLAVILARTKAEQMEVTGTSKPGDEKKKFAMQAFGAHFCEVHVDPDLGTTRVVRWVSAHACGRVLNEKTARSQIQGGIVMGIGMALMEETVIDHRWGRLMTDDLADYHVPVHADMPAIESHFVPEVDTIGVPIGTKGIGEIGIVGTAAAIANAIYHATGQRVRDLPITPDKLLSA